jgi:F-type H+-transporting ATPase subunit b
VTLGPKRSFVAAWSLAVALALAAPAVAHAEDRPTEANAGAHVGAEDAEAAEPAPKLDLRKLGLQVLNFAVLATLLGWFGGKAINKALYERHQQLKIDLVAASEARAAAEKRVADQEDRLTSLESEIESIRAGIKVEAEAEKQRLIAAAEERSRRIADETKFLLDQQVKEAEATLRREVAEAAVKIAEQLVTRSFDGRDQQRLLDTFVADVAAPESGGTGRSA